ncbi:hypothetical protein GCM10027275_45560 [Rhabdobacter roseus]|uniref:Outer membrane protein beta-barrel domain-containing protein n=1 Tax=Rhabdobacter roseus TaxID=1655419 RepID=A0A840TR21_9BACT|nr:hypothetical protein [Rhabdobacter roseus]MBB5286776.1 hypothetical protein [Rhabdobacter roseus]
MKRLPLLNWVLLSVGVLSFASCRTVYAPNAINTPLFQERGESKITLATNNLQAATAVSDHIGIMANGYFNAFTSDDRAFRNNGYGLEAGVGVFGSNENRISYEAYGGVGFLNVKIRENNDAKNFRAQGTKFFIQPAVGWVNPYFEVAFSPRLSVVKYGTPELSGYTAQEQADYYFNTLADAPHAFIEPTLILRGGYRWVKVQAQFGRSLKLTKNNLNYDDNVGSVGLIFNLARWYRD